MGVRQEDISKEVISQIKQRSHRYRKFVKALNRCLSQFEGILKRINFLNRIFKDIVLPTQRDYRQALVLALKPLH
jgi:hypothetical protein